MPVGPPKKRVVARPAEKTICKSDDNRKKPNFFPEYSTSQPPTISVSAVGISNGLLSNSACEDKIKTKKKITIGRLKRVGLLASSCHCTIPARENDCVLSATANIANKIGIS